jgi:primosomal replication protein N
MNNFLSAIKKFNAVPLYLFPLLYLFIGVYFKILVGDLSLTSVDPDYVYFLSGVSISEGYLKIGHIDHPGSPLQYLIAIVLRITYLFRKDAGIPYLEDILSHSDLYVSVVNITLTVVMSISLLIAGKYVFRKTGSVVYGMIIQTVPFIPFIWYQLIGRIVPELLLPIPIIALSAFLLGHFVDKKEKFDTRDLIILSVIMAFSLSIKLTMISLWLIPIVIVKPWRSKLLVIALSFFLFLVFAIPATIQIDRFWSWISNLFVHSGNYGSGSKNIVDIISFKSNFNKITQLYKHFTYLVVFQLLLIPVSFFWFRKKQYDFKKIYLIVSVFFTILIQAFITAKHYAPHYFIPGLLLGPLLLLLSIDIIKEYYPGRALVILSNIFLVIVIYWHINQQLINVNYASQGVGNHVSAREETRHYAKTFEKESIKIITSQGYGCPLPEYAILFSTAWLANPLKPRYNEILARLYPNTYQYTTFDDRFRFWGEEFNPQKIIEQKIPVYLYLEYDTDELYNKTIAKVFGDSTNFRVEKQLIFHNEKNGEGLLKLLISNK